MNAKTRAVGALLAASALAWPVAALAASPQTPEQHQAELEARLARMEQEIIALRADLQAARAQAAPAPVPASAPVPAPILAPLAGPPPMALAAAPPASATANTQTTPPAQGFRSGNSTVMLSGYIKLLASSARYSGGDDASNSLGRDLYLPQAVPVYNPASPTSPTRVTDFTAKQTHFWVDANTRLGRHALKAYIEFDFQAAPGTPQALGQGTQRTTNAYDLAMRRAFFQFDRWMFGQDFTNFSNPAVYPESTDYVGGVDGLIFVRQPMIRYSLPLGSGVMLHVAAENPETASSTAGSATMIENGEDHAPDMTARLEYAGKFGFVDFAMLGRQLRLDNAKAGAQRIEGSRLGWGLSTTARLFLDAHQRSDIRLQATYGEGIGRYLGLNFSPDTVLQANGRLGQVRHLGLFAAGRIALDEQWRINLIGSFQAVSYAGYLDRTSAGIAMYNRQAWSLAGNLFYSPVHNVDLGVEYRHGERRLVNDLSGQVDRFDFAAKYSF